MDDDIAPLPATDAKDTMNVDESNWNGSANDGGGARTPPRRRSSRSRSPGARDHRGGRDDDRGGRGRTNRDRDARDEGDNNPGNNLHVSGLSHRVDSRDLETAFAKVGRVQKASVMFDPHTRESRGFGFVTMESAEEAEAAVTALHGTEFMGRPLVVEKARRGRARTPTPGRYHGPTKRRDHGERPYDPRPYDSRYARDYDNDRRGGGGRSGGGRRDDRRDYDRDRDRDRGDRGSRRDDDRGDRRDRDYDRRY
ncbi:hypothetical protein C8J56DRAFT_987047 [Mycena floridula]|nr:hypothetical protein C8J56DRAFT_987047 [Mycena floridula]